jgi:hypothetical protein
MENNKKILNIFYQFIFNIFFKIKLNILKQYKSIVLYYKRCPSLQAPKIHQLIAQK